LTEEEPPSHINNDCHLTLEHLQVSLDLVKAERVLLDQRKEASKLRKKLKGTQGYRESRKLLDLQRARLDKLKRTKAKANRIATRISKMQPSGWKEFLQVRQSSSLNVASCL
jgi:hypothetical protein